MLGWSVKLDKKKILVVEDEESLLKLENILLTSNGYHAVSARNGTEALKMLERENIDLVLLDVMLPDIDGYEVCRRIKADAVMQKIPVLMVTAKNHSDDIDRGGEAGADWYVTKPFKSANMLNAVKRLLP